MKVIQLHGRDTSYTQSLEVISGEMTSQGIKNFQLALVLLGDYGDPHNRLIPVNTGRVFYDEDSLAENQTSFRKKQDFTHYIELPTLDQWKL